MVLDSIAGHAHRPASGESIAIEALPQPAMASLSGKLAKIVKDTRYSPGKCPLQAPLVA
jgi:hypothetical protein